MELRALKGKNGGCSVLDVSELNYLNSTNQHGGAGKLNSSILDIKERRA